MPVMPKRACWADMADDSGDEMMAGANEIGKKEEDEQMPEGEASPAASFCSTNFGDDLDCSQSAHPSQFDGANFAMPSMQWPQNPMLPAIFGPFAVIPVVGANASSLPTPAFTSSMDGFQGFSGEPLGKNSRTDAVKKSFLKQGSQHRNRRPLLIRQKTKEFASGALPEASAEDWQRRLDKRCNIVVTIKESPEYKAFSAHRRGPRRAALRTPSPNDRSVSKRQWEEKVQKWRAALRKLHSNNTQK